MNNLKPLKDIISDINAGLKDGFALRVTNSYRDWNLEVYKNNATQWVFNKDVTDILNEITKAYNFHYIDLNKEEYQYIIENTLMPESATKYLMENTQRAIKNMQETAERYRGL